MVGWILHVGASQHDRLEDRAQDPCYRHPDFGFVYEVWIWHRLLQRWFCMSTASDPAMIAQGVVYFRPNDISNLRSTMKSLEHAVGIQRL